MTIMWLSYLSMPFFEGDHRRDAFVGLGQTTRSTGGATYRQINRQVSREQVLSKRNLFCYHDSSLATAVEERNEGLSDISNDEEGLSHTQ